MTDLQRRDGNLADAAGDDLIQQRGGFAEFFHTETAGAIMLLVATAVALILANSPLHEAMDALFQTELGIHVGTWEFSLSVLHWIDDGLMALFFFVVGLEIKREFIVGELADRRKATLPILAAVGGMMVPALVYFAFNVGGPGVHGWGVPMATDIAFALGVLALLGSRVPLGLRVFLTALAIADDIGAILVIAIFYTANVSLIWLGVVVLLFVVLLVLARRGVDNRWPYAIVGVGLWAAMLASGVHATIAGVLVAFTIPATARLAPFDFTTRTRRALDAIDTACVPGEHTLVDNSRVEVCNDIRRDTLHTMAPLQRMESALHPWTTFVILPLFALGNAGVRLVGVDVGELLTSQVSLGILFGLVVGKPVGIFVMTWLAVHFRLADLPEGVNWLHVLGAGVLGGIGFTMSLFVANLAFTSTDQTAAAKAAILIASVIAGTVGYALLRGVRPPSNDAL